jgi:hypothetical protein
LIRDGIPAKPSGVFMDLALKVFAALFASAATLNAIGIVKFVFGFVVPKFAELNGDHRSTALIGVGLGYFVLLTVIYALTAWLLWRREKWGRALLLAVTACLGFPVGPLLGIPTIILLTRPAVKALFKV